MRTSVIKIDAHFELLDEIKRNLDSTGFFCLKNAISSHDLKIFQTEILKLIELKGKRYFSIINPFKNSDSKFSIFLNDQNLKKFLYSLGSETFDDHETPDNQEILNVLRVVTGENADSQTMNFHFDATRITILIPILIPKGPILSSGHLLALKNIRPIRKVALFNLIEKILFQNYISQKLLSLLINRKINEYLNILEEGNIYFFNGYRTLHSNLKVDPLLTRATLLFHFGDPHMDSFFIKTISKIRHFRETRNSK